MRRRTPRLRNRRVELVAIIASFCGTGRRVIRRRAGVAEREVDSAGFVGAAGCHSIAEREERGTGGGRR